jgi:hypothetical protein
MIYEVTIACPPINEVVVTSADNRAQATLRAIYSAGNRAVQAGLITGFADLLVCIYHGDVSVKILPTGTRTDADAWGVDTFPPLPAFA